MHDIYFDFPVNASAAQVFRAVSTPEGLNAWWTDRSEGLSAEGAEYKLWFGPEYDWRANVTRCVADAEFELQMTAADANWLDTRVGFRLDGDRQKTSVHFYHRGWPILSEHYRASSYCWAMYLRLLRRYLEYGEVIAYRDRLQA